LEDHLYIADVRNFNSRSRMKKVPCAMKPFTGLAGAGWGEDDFQYQRPPRFFSFTELQDFGLLDGSGMNERSKIPCAVCDAEFPAEELFYDDMSRRFMCEACSFDCSEKDDGKTRDLFELSGV
jgi:hypothetical protein